MVLPTAVRLARRLRGVVAVVTLSAFVAGLTGCTSWKPLRTPYEQALGDRPLDRATVRLTDGRSMTLYEPHVLADSLLGYTRKVPLRGRTVVPLDDVLSLETRHTDAVLTAVVVGAGALALATVLLVIAFNDAFPPGT